MSSLTNRTTSTNDGQTPLLIRYRDGSTEIVSATIYGNVAVYPTTQKFNCTGYAIEHVGSGCTIAVFAHERVAHSFAKRLDETIPLDTLSDVQENVSEIINLSQHPALKWDARRNPGASAFTDAVQTGGAS